MVLLKRRAVVWQVTGPGQTGSNVVCVEMRQTIFRCLPVGEAMPDDKERSSAPL
jgi:hypothetical protein